MIRFYQRMYGGQWSSLWRKQSPLRLPIVFSCAREQCGEMERVIAMQSVRVVMQRGSQKVVRNWHLMKKGKWHVIMSFIISGPVWSLVVQKERDPWLELDGTSLMICILRGNVCGWRWMMILCLNVNYHSLWKSFIFVWKINTFNCENHLLFL